MQNKRWNSLRRQRRSRRGTATVELALGLPVMATILLGMMDLNQMIYHRQSVTLAAYEGARVGSNRWTTQADMTTRTNQILTARRIASGASTTFNMPATPVTGDRIDVTVTAPFSGVLLQNFNVSATVSVVRQ